jgi:hypothetical protein
MFHMSDGGDSGESFKGHCTQVLIIHLKYRFKWPNGGGIKKLILSMLKLKMDTCWRCTIYLMVEMVNNKTFLSNQKGFIFFSFQKGSSRFWKGRKTKASGFHATWFASS